MYNTVCELHQRAMRTLWCKQPQHSWAAWWKEWRRAEWKYTFTL